ncbi:MAG: SRPBCC domain-containing protein [Archangium sp.]
MAENITVTDIIPASPEAVYAAWLDAEQHSRMTNSPATDEGDGRFTAGAGYISGRTVSAVPHSKIVQSWRTKHFGIDDANSTVVISLEPFEDGTRVTITHTDIPDEQANSYRDGWNANYFEPMKAYFSSPIGKAWAAVQGAKLKARSGALEAVKAVKKARKNAAKKIKTVAKKAKALVSPAKKKKPARKAPPKKKARAAPKKKAKAAPQRKR